MTNSETTLVMVQKFIPQVREGDKRVLTLGTEVLPYSIKKLPTKDDFKFNTHNDDFIVSAELTKKEMENFAEMLEYEKAAAVRDQIREIEEKYGK